MIDRSTHFDNANMLFGSLSDPEFLDSVIENIPHMIFVKDAEHLRFVRINRAGEELLGMKREELIGRTDFDFFPPQEAKFFTDADREVLTSGTLREIREETIHTRSGVRYLNTKKIPLRSPEGKPAYLLGISEDITDKRKLEDERDSTQRQISKLEIERELREEFISTLSHDLRNPLTAAKANAQLMLNFPDHPRVQKLPEKIIENLNQADHMIRDLLDVNRIRAGQKLPLDVERCDLNALIREVLDQLSTVHGQRFVLNAPEQTEALCGYWSKAELRRALENLLTNAVKYGDTDRPITVSVSLASPSVRIDVHNFGRPIPLEEQSQLFKMFTRSKAALKSGKKGWGVGLTLVRGVAEAHGGSVQLRSHEQEGTTFSLEIPLDCRLAA